MDAGAQGGQHALRVLDVAYGHARHVRVGDLQLGDQLCGHFDMAGVKVNQYRLWLVALHLLDGTFVKLHHANLCAVAHALHPGAGQCSFRAVGMDEQQRGIEFLFRVCKMDGQGFATLRRGCFVMRRVGGRQYGFGGSDAQPLHLRGCFGARAGAHGQQSFQGGRRGQVRQDRWLADEFWCKGLGLHDV